MWDRGKYDTITSSSLNSTTSELMLMVYWEVQEMLSWLSMTPLGWPVVPLV